MSPVARRLLNRANRARFVGLHALADECLLMLDVVLLTEDDA